MHRLQNSRPTRWYTLPEIPTRFGTLRQQRLAFDGPAERLCHRGTEVGDEALNPLLEMLLGCEVAAAEKFADQDREPDLDLVEPRGVLGREVEGNAMTDIAQECLAGRHRLEDAGFPLLAEVFIDAAELCDQTDHSFGDVGIEIVADHLPSSRRCRGEQRLQERHEIRLGASIPDGAADVKATDDELIVRRSGN